jgi:hypothetical protein
MTTQPISRSEINLNESYSRNTRFSVTETRTSKTSRVAALQKRLFTKAAVIGARSAWSLNEWNLMDTFVSQLPEDNIDACFMRAVLAIHHENYLESAQLIEQTRRHLDSNITALLAESYGRAYVPLIMVQQCSELEEIAEFKMLMREAGLDDWRQDSLTNNSNHDSGNISVINTNNSMSPIRIRTPSNQVNTPLSPRSKIAVKLSDFATEDNAAIITNEQSQQFSLQVEARYDYALFIMNIIITVQCPHLCYVSFDL